MSVSVTSSGTWFLGVLSSGTWTQNISVGDSELVVVSVAYGHTSNVLRDVYLDNKRMDLLSSPFAVDIDAGFTQRIYVLKVRRGGTYQLKITASIYYGNATVGFVSLAGTDGTIGSNWKTNFNGSISSTLGENPQSTASRTLAFVGEWFTNGGVVPSPAAVLNGYTRINTINSNNFGMHIITGSSAFTFGISAPSWGQCIVVAIEIKEGVMEWPAESPIKVTTSGAWYAGHISSTGSLSWSNTVNLTNETDMVVVGLIYQSIEGQIPSVSIGGQRMLPIGRPVVENKTSGYTMRLFGLKSPPIGNVELNIQTTFWFGHMAVGLIGLSGAGQDIGARWSTDFNGTSSNIIGYNPDIQNSLTVAMAGEWFTNGLLTVSEGFILQASMNSAVSDSSNRIGMHVISGNSSGPFQIFTPSWGQGSVLAIEVYEIESHIVEPKVKIVATEILDYDVIGYGTVTKTLNVEKCDTLLLAVCRGYQNIPVVHVNGVRAYISDFHKYSTDNGAISVFCVNNIDATKVDITLTGYVGYWGPTIVAAIALNHSSGQIGALSPVLGWGYALKSTIEETKSSSRLVEINASFWSQMSAPSGAFGFKAEKYISGSFLNVGIMSARPNYWGEFFLQRTSSNQASVILEFLAIPEASPNISGDAILKMPAPKANIVASSAIVPPRSDLVFDIYYESYLEAAKDPRTPDAWYLSRMPPYVNRVMLSFGHPQMTYKNLDDNIAQTVGFGGTIPRTSMFPFPGNGHQLKACLDLLRSRHPNVKITFSITEQSLGSYHPDGWGGMTDANILSCKKFMDDMGIKDFSLDYEGAGKGNDTYLHCWTNNLGERVCYMDAELTNTIKRFRTALPRANGYTILWTPPSVGAYFGPYANNAPMGWSSGYAACLTRDPVALAALDGMHVMTYDATVALDPIRALEAYMYHFPTCPMYIGLRAGPREWGSSEELGSGHEGRKMTLADCMEYINAANHMGAAGCFMWSLIWDIVEPSGDRGANWPDSNQIAQLVARQWNLPRPDMPLVSDGTLDGGIIDWT